MTACPTAGTKKPFQYFEGPRYRMMLEVGTARFCYLEVLQDELFGRHFRGERAASHASNPKIVGQ